MDSDRPGACTLTGLLNRRRFQEEFERWGKYALRYERSMASMFINLDKFKDINDIHGHLGGDEYLLAVACLLKKVCARPMIVDYAQRFAVGKPLESLGEFGAAT